MSEDGATIAGYTLLMGTHLYTAFLLHKVYKNRAHPCISVRRINLIALTASLAFAYDAFWVIDAIVSYQTESSLACGKWEFFDGVYSLSTIVVNTIRAWVLYVSLKKMKLTMDVMTDTSPRTVTGSSEDPIIKRNSMPKLTEKLRNDLRSLQRVSSARFVSFALVLISLFFLMFYIINWAQFPDLVNMNWNDFEENYGEICYISWSYQLCFYSMFPIGIFGAVCCAFADINFDTYHLRKEISISLTVWLLYWIMNQTLNYTIGYNEIVGIYVWILMRMVQNYLCYYVPLKSVKQHDAAKMSEHSLTESLMSTSSRNVTLQRETRILLSILADDEASEDFRQFLAKEFAVEFFLFLKSVQTFEELYRLYDTSDEVLYADIKDQILSTTREIISLYLTVGGPLEMNIPPNLKHQMVATSSAKDFFPLGDFFSFSRKLVLEELSKSSLPRYLNTDSGKAYKKKLTTKVSEAFVINRLSDA